MMNKSNVGNAFLSFLSACFENAWCLIVLDLGLLSWLFLFLVYLLL